ncbi:MAG: nuclear transport factor 2 family protein [Chloracidobacterium sp.]|nr:nuclear transport factor 2 family protein [Chloracidobacterium sp.]
MNETENTKLVQLAYEKFGSGDIDGLLELVSDEIRWTTPAVEGASHTGARRGKDDVAEFFKLLSESEDFERFEPLEFVAQDDKVVVLGESSARIKSTGRNFESSWVHIFHVRDGKISEFLEFFDNVAATKAYQKAAKA